MKFEFYSAATTALTAAGASSAGMNEFAKNVGVSSLRSGFTLLESHHGNPFGPNPQSPQTRTPAGQFGGSGLGAAGIDFRTATLCTGRIGILRSGEVCANDAAGGDERARSKRHSNRAVFIVFSISVVD